MIKITPINIIAKVVSTAPVTGISDSVVVVVIVLSGIVLLSGTLVGVTVRVGVTVVAPMVIVELIN